MTSPAIATATDLVNAYYAAWQDGPSHFDEQAVRGVLAPELVFEGPIAGRRVGAEGFLKGLGSFVAQLRAMRMLQQVHGPDGAAYLYDADLGHTAGTLRFAEFITVQDARISNIRLVYDPAEFRRLTA